MKKAIAILCAAMMPGAAFAQGPDDRAYPQPQGQLQNQATLLTPQQLDNLVAPIALYPDPLLGQVLAASTYPLEIVEAQQWLSQNRNLSGQQLVDAAKQQNWDASVQALVAFPEAMTMLTRDIRWTTDLGNAVLAQQGDVMAAVQRLRGTARSNGRLATNAQQVVTDQTQDGQTAIGIQPANPQVIYVPVYNPVYVWGPPAWGVYPPLWYPTVGFGFGFGPGIFIGGLFPGLLGWGAWGWGLGWFAHSLFVSPFFFSHYGFHGFYGGGFGAHGAFWAHNPAHRLGVAYSNSAVASRFGGANGAARFNGAARGGATTRGMESRGGFTPRTEANSGWRRFDGGSANANRSFSGANRSSGPSASGLNRGLAEGFRSNNLGARNQNEGARNFSPASRGFAAAPRQNFNASRPSQSFGGGQRFSQGSSQHFSAPRSSAPRAPSGGSHFSGGGRSSGGGGGHSSGGGSHRR